jgi:hypothetical protein
VEADATRPQPSPSLGAAAATGGVSPGTSAEVGQEVRSRCRPLKRRASARAHDDGQPEPAPDATRDQASFVSVSDLAGLAPCIIDWSGRMTRAEEDLHRAVMVSVISDRPVVLAKEVAALIATWLEVEPASMILQQVAPLMFLLTLPSTALVEPLVDRRPLLRAATFSVACKWWNRFAGSVGGVLPNLVEFELRGIPAHAWETNTVAQILNPFAWIRAIHPDSLGPVSRDVFWCTAWAADPATIPAVKDLWVVEPPMVADEDPPGKRTLIYPIHISFIVLQSLSGAASPSGDDDDDSSDVHPRRRRRELAGSRPHSLSPEGGGRGAA